MVRVTDGPGIGLEVIARWWSDTRDGGFHGDADGANNKKDLGAGSCRLISSFDEERLVQMHEVEQIEMTIDADADDAAAIERRDGPFGSCRPRSHRCRTQRRGARAFIIPISGENF
ncbi:MAG TPA: hypothetical protein VGG01_06135 [Xanthobacteraceae bacterium]